MDNTAPATSSATEYDLVMAKKLERIKRDPEAYYAEARKGAYRDELRRALMPWSKSHSGTA